MGEEECRRWAQFRMCPVWGEVTKWLGKRQRSGLEIWIWESVAARPWGPPPFQWWTEGEASALESDKHWAQLLAELGDVLWLPQRYFFLNYWYFEKMFFKFEKQILGVKDSSQQGRSLPLLHETPRIVLLSSHRSGNLSSSVHSEYPNRFYVLVTNGKKSIDCGTTYYTLRPETRQAGNDRVNLNRIYCQYGKLKAKKHKNFCQLPK